ncbi:hypothetical protein CMV_007675 [Castanea mollissima]|uniref:RNase H type-1 domain-containing protein n=1 Tax=Castanea mollissima TaxID=60419 RepID=A0A8J4R9R6_9ROSI|nr:hypothetical protein CMV_007675 [Castanea mollissima]
MWLSDPSCEKVVIDAWEANYTKHQHPKLYNCIDECRQKLMQWNVSEFSHVGRNIDLLQEKLQLLEEKPAHTEDTVAIDNVRKDLNIWLEMEETMRNQDLKLRICKRILLIKATLCHRHIISNPVCKACGLAAETTGHLLWDCNRAKEIWNGGIWLNKNEIRNGEPVKSGREIVRRALYLVDEFFAANLPTQNEAEVKWSASPRNKLNINVDKAVFKNTGEARIGVIIRHSQGHVVGEQSKKIPFPIGAIEAEALAVEVGILFASDLGMAEVILESDSWNVVKAV